MTLPQMLPGIFAAASLSFLVSFDELVLSLFVSQKLGTFVNNENHEDLIVLGELTESGKITPVIDRTYPLSEVPQAMRYLEAGHARGKVVITV